MKVASSSTETPARTADEPGSERIHSSSPVPAASSGCQLLSVFAVRKEGLIRFSLARYSTDGAELQVSGDFVQTASRDDSLSGEPFGCRLVGQYKTVRAII
jgi:hypothetical protein